MKRLRCLLSDGGSAEGDRGGVSDGDTTTADEELETLSQPLGVLAIEAGSLQLL